MNPLREMVFETIAVAAEPTLQEKANVHPPGIEPGFATSQAAVLSVGLWVPEKVFYHEIKALARPLLLRTSYPSPKADQTSK